ncbi:NAD(P)-binding protein [Mucidula mucida]|nr:NAD(P)-binding protein [Mucidula mucida]
MDPSYTNISAFEPIRAQLVWLVTGTSSGLGKRIVLSALARGDKVIATARNLNKLRSTLPVHCQNLKTIELDVDSGYTNIKHTINEAVKIWGGIDVLVNNAGIGVKAVFEEGGSEMFRRQFQTNVFGVIDVTTAVLPHMRKRGTGTIVQVGSRSSWTAECVPTWGQYSSSKAALRAFSETLATEVEPFGIRVLIAEPAENPISSYEDVRTAAMRDLSGSGFCTGDATKAMDVLVDVVRGEGKARGKEWPLYFVFGPGGEKAVRHKCEKILRVMDEWKDVTDALL